MPHSHVTSYLDEDKSDNSGTNSNEDSDEKNSDNSDENSDEDGSEKGSDESGSDKDSDEEGSEDGSDKDSEDEDDDDDSDATGKKKKKGKMTAIDDLPAYKPSPFQDAMSKLREIMFDLDSVSSTIDLISMKFGSYKGPSANYSPPYQQRKQSPPRNYFPPG